jgi:hypothetical protein
MHAYSATNAFEYRTVLRGSVHRLRECADGSARLPLRDHSPTSPNFPRLCFECYGRPHCSFAAEAAAPAPRTARPRST